MNIWKKTGKLLRKYSHAWVFLYVLIYMPWFTWLEHRTGVQYTMIHSPLDPYIPFVEYFVVPYLLWFFFISATGLYFFFTEKQNFYRLAAFTITGMTLFLIICTFFPNGQNLRLRLLTIRTSLHSWYRSYMPQIRPPTYCQACMCIIHWAQRSPSPTAAD